jgi:heme/copper-type cytochrome/quinol oxidase subunit 4
MTVRSPKEPRKVISFCSLCTAKVQILVFLAKILVLVLVVLEELWIMRTGREGVRKRDFSGQD